MDQFEQMKVTRQAMNGKMCLMFGGIFLMFSAITSTVLLHFVCAVYFDPGLCNSSEKTSELIQLIQHPPERKYPFIGTILSGGCFFIFLSDLCVEADTLVYFHNPITPTAKASHAVVLSRILQVRTIRGWYALHRLFLPSPR